MSSKRMEIDDVIVNNLNEEDDEVIGEIDLYATGGALGRHVATYALSYPLRLKDAPYENIQNVRFKSKVKRMQWDIPMDTRSNYNPDAPAVARIQNTTLQSSRVDPGMHGLALARRYGDAICLVPINEVLQMRHSPAYLDKDREIQYPVRGGRHGASTSAAAAVVDVKQEDGTEDLNVITVQVKKHETDAQMEARLRSYAFHQAQEEADHWVELRYRSATSHSAANILSSLPEIAEKAVVPEAFHAQESYLDVITPGSTTLLETLPDEDAGNANRLSDLGRMSGTAGASGRQVVGQLAPDALAALPSTLNLLFGHSSVLSLENVRSLMKNLANNGVLNRAAETASDSALHHAILGAGDYIHIRRCYTLRISRDHTVEPLRSMVLELLKDKEQLKRQDVLQAAELRGIEVTDTQYSKVMKELCTSRGSLWTLKTGAA